METSDLYKIFIGSSGVTTDTRKISAGNMFFALSGENFDGNSFAQDALNKGCSYAVVDKAEFVKDRRYILVDDCLVALQKLARFHRDQFNIPFIGITGSNGKTTTKELIAKVLGANFKVLFTEGNLNNHIGVPLTLLRVNKETDVAIIEMGANHPGEIEFLCNIAMPTHGVITNIGKAHLEGFGGFEGVKKTKNELYLHLIKNEGTIFANTDNTILRSLLDDKQVSKVFYGSSQGSQCNGEIIKADPFLEFEVLNKDVISTKLAGRYNLENALAAICIGLYFDISFDKIKSALESYEPSNQRSQMKNSAKNRLLMDCYNANPSSMEVALENFREMEHTKKAVILGDMLELGDDTEAEHRKIIAQVQSMDIEMAIFVGPIFDRLVDKTVYKSFITSEDAREWVQTSEFEGYLFLLKGSRGIKLEKIAEIM
jgi:UDP-N-acetylmuramoyl-tripeptide--D-alanyl-D-alanine ligase